MPLDTTDIAWRLVTPRGAGAAAITVIELLGDVDLAIARLNLAPISIGAFSLRDFGDLDRGIVARWSAHCAHLMPHGGSALLGRIEEWLTKAGVPCASENPAGRALRQSFRAAHPESASDIEALALMTLGSAASPGAVDLLLQQGTLWKGHDTRSERTSPQSDRDRVLSRLLNPPLVVIAGAPNAGKSRLMNALAGQTVSIVSAQPGTTRDHVGIHAICGDVAIRLVDTAGVRYTQDAIETQAQSLANRLLAHADMVLCCSDPEHPIPTDLATRFPHARVVHIRTKTDLFGPDPGAQFSISAETGEGIQSLALGLSERLVPQACRAASEPWRFWPGEAF